MKTDLPKCFSPRERLFLVKSMVKDFKEIFTAMEELMGYQFNINVSGDMQHSHQFPVCCLSNVSPTMMIFSLFNMVKWVASLWWWQWFFWVSQPQPVPDPAAPRSVVLVMAPCSCPLHDHHSDTSVTLDDDGWQVLRELAATWTEKQIKYSALYLHNN